MTDDPLDRKITDGGMAFANSIGAVLSRLTSGQIGMGVTGVGPNISGTEVGPTTAPDSLSTAQATPPTPTSDGNNELTKAQAPAPTPGAATDTVDPVPQGTPIASPYGPRNSGFHHGVDLGVPNGTTLKAAISGTVTHAANDDPNGYGSWVEITGANGMSVRYGHLSYIGAKVGQQVNAGQPIGKSGGIQGAQGSGDSTGPHLHFEVRVNGQPIDPSNFLSSAGDSGAATEGSDASATASATAAAPPKTVQPADAAATAGNRLTGALTGNDPGSENQPVPQPATTQPAAANGKTTGADNDPNAVGAFLAATKQHESAGNYQARYSGPARSDAAGAYQFLSTTWRGAGGSTASADQATPEEQDRVAHNMAMALFNQFHSWRLVAIAWYGGPGKAAEVAAGRDPGSPDGQGSYIAYGNLIAQMMAGGH